MDVRTLRRDLNILENTPGVKQVIARILAYYDLRDANVELPVTYYSMIISEVVYEWKEALAKISPKQKELFDEGKEEDKL
jgi:hypothetical protein